MAADGGAGERPKQLFPKSNPGNLGWGGMAGIYKDAAPLRRAGDVLEEGDQTVLSTVPITVVEPDVNPRGGIVVLHEARETTDSLLGLVRALANEGWVVIVPDLFHRSATDVGEGVFGDDLFEDFDACFDWLTARGVFADCVGVLGFDDAGTAAFLVATNRPVGAAVSIAARGIVAPLGVEAPALVAAAPTLQAPWLGLFGMDDPATPAEQVDRLADAVAVSVVAANVVRYSGLRHRADQPNDVDLAAADLAETERVDAQTRVFDWFDSFLR